MEPLKREFTGRGEVRGFAFKCLEERRGIGYLYEVSAEGFTHYEVFKHAENSFLSRVAYPGSNGFGVWAWTFFTKEAALGKLDLLCQIASDDKQSRKASTLSAESGK